MIDEYLKFHTTIPTRHKAFYWKMNIINFDHVHLKNKKIEKEYIYIYRGAKVSEFTALFV